MGSGLDQLSDRAECELTMQTTRRGEPVGINQALNQSREKLGLNLPTWLVIVMVSVMAFLAGFHMLAVVSLPLLAAGCWIVVRRHPKMFQLWALSLSQRSYYDPRK
jgi:type IV secretory pathway VirB3-like protein